MKKGVFTLFGIVSGVILIILILSNNIPENVSKNQELQKIYKHNHLKYPN